MKQKLLFSLAVMTTLACRSQTVTPMVLSNQGGFTALSGGSISWSIGEPVSETYTTVTKVTTMGFHQPELDLINLIAEQGVDKNILVYPNPVRDLLSVNFSGLNSGNYSLQLMDNLGKLIHQSDVTISENNQIFKLKMDEIAMGNYLLRVYNKDFSKTVKINKVN